MGTFDISTISISLGDESIYVFVRRNKFFVAKVDFQFVTKKVFLNQDIDYLSIVIAVFPQLGSEIESFKEASPNSSPPIQFSQQQELFQYRRFSTL